MKTKNRKFRPSEKYVFSLILRIFITHLHILVYENLNTW